MESKEHEKIDSTKWTRGIGCTITHKFHFKEKHLRMGDALRNPLGKEQS